MRYALKKPSGYYFNPSRAMRKAGFRSCPLGKDPDAAAEKLAELIAEWEAVQEKLASPEIVEPSRGDFLWLVDRFQRDPTWYNAKARATREEMDYAFNIILNVLGPTIVRKLERRHGRLFYNGLRDQGASIHKARKVMKWFRRLMRYAQEIGVRDDNPLSDMIIEVPAARDQVWTPEEVEAVIEAARSGGKAKSGNTIPARPSIALAIMIAYDTSLPQQDILALKWDQFEDGGLNVRQLKRRGDKKLWIPLSQRTLNAMRTPALSPYIIVSETTRQPYLDQGSSKSQRMIFSRMFRRFKERAGITRNLTFHDLRRTALSNLGNAGATEAEIVSFSGHAVGSRILETYVKPDRRAAQNAGRKRDGIKPD